MLPQEIGHVIFRFDTGQLIGGVMTLLTFGFFLFRKFNKLNNVLSLTVASVNALGQEVSGMKKSLELIARSEVRIEHLERSAGDHENRIREVENVTQGFGFSYSSDQVL